MHADMFHYMQKDTKGTVCIIKPPRRWFYFDIAELWQYRELLVAFVKRNVRVRYKQTFLGVAWAVFQPLLTMVVFSIFFGYLAKMPSEGIPYPIFVFSGLLFWYFFSSALSAMSNSMVDSASMIQKIYFPRLILPLSAAITPLIDFGISFLILFGIMAYYGFVPHMFGIFIIPFLLLASVVAVSGIGFFLCALNVRYRDVKYILPFCIQILLFVTPVIYPVSMVPKEWQWIVYLNPMAGIIESARYGIIEGRVDTRVLILSLVVGFIFMFVGMIYFKKTERFFADEI